ncbi:unnamed protein product, partial [Coccothraustes coccothraustes]
ACRRMKVPNSHKDPHSLSTNLGLPQNRKGDLWNNSFSAFCLQRKSPALGASPWPPQDSLQSFSVPGPAHPASQEFPVPSLPPIPALWHWEPFPGSCPSMPCPQSLCSSPGAPPGPARGSELCLEPSLLQTSSTIPCAALVQHEDLGDTVGRRQGGVGKGDLWNNSFSAFCLQRKSPALGASPWPPQDSLQSFSVPGPAHPASQEFP